MPARIALPELSIALPAVLAFVASCSLPATDVDGLDEQPPVDSSDEVDDGQSVDDTGPEPGEDEPPTAEEPEISPIEIALDFGQSVAGTPYGWWYSGPLPKGAPMWTAAGPAPAPSKVLSQSTNCSGLTNLMLREIGLPLPDAPGAGRGGTYAYQMYYADVAVPFDVNETYPAGTLIGRRYRDTYDQGHVAVVLEDGQVLQSFAWKRGGSVPGVNTTYTVAESHDGGFYEYAVYPEDWLGGE